MRTLAIICSLFIWTALAADVTGSWKVNAQGADGEHRGLVLTLKEEGGKLSGSLTTAEGQTVPLDEVKLDGQELSFKIAVDEGSYVIKMTAGDGKLKGTYVSPSGAKGTVEATR